MLLSMSVARIRASQPRFMAPAFCKAPWTTIAIEYGSSPDEHAADQILSLRCSAVASIRSSSSASATK